MVLAAKVLLKDVCETIFNQFFQYITTHNIAEPLPASEAAKYVLLYSDKSSCIYITRTPIENLSSCEVL